MTSLIPITKVIMSAMSDLLLDDCPCVGGGAVLGLLSCADGLAKVAIVVWMVQ